MEPTGGKNPCFVLLVGYIQNPGSGLLGVSSAFRPLACLQDEEDSAAVFQE